jgi:dimethylhistidine N-methyltransferase
MFDMLDVVEPRPDQYEAFRTDVLTGMSRRQKAIPSRWLYDRRGSELFEEITELAEYYLTRTETAILRQHAREIGLLSGREVVLLEYGAGAGAKFEIIIRALSGPRMYVPIDISAGFLAQTVARIQRSSAQFLTRPIVADFTKDFAIPEDIPRNGRVAFFLGSTIGNLNTTEAVAVLRRMRSHTGERGKAIVGVDLCKGVDILIPAYDDRLGVTAAFNLNLLARINRELGANFFVAGFVHEARWNDAESAVEMHLVSLAKQAVTIAGHQFFFEEGETLHTETSRKYSISGFDSLVQCAGWSVTKVWTDGSQRFAVFGLDAAR